MRTIVALLVALLAAGACAGSGLRSVTPTGGTAGPLRLTWKHVSFAILEDYDLGDDLAEPARDFALFRQLGITSWRGSISWLQVEPERGHRDFGWLQRFAQLAADSGIQLQPYIAYTPQWAARGGSDSVSWNDPPRSLADWSAFVRALAAAVAPYRSVVSLEIYNEENTTPWWDGSRASYDSVLAASATAIHAVAPRLRVILGGMVWPDAAWTEAACAATHVDVVPFHAYPETWTPESVTVETYLHDYGFAGFLPVERSACGRAPVWINETGFATVGGRTEQDQAVWWARAIPSFLSAPAVEEIGVYEIKDLRPNANAIGGAPNYHLGLTDTLRRPKLAFNTVRLLARLLGTDSLAVLDSALQVQSSDSTARLYVHDFLRPDGAQVIAAWSRRSPTTVSVRLPISGRRAVWYRLDGTISRRTAVEGDSLTLRRLEPGEVRLVEVLPR